MSRLAASLDLGQALCRGALGFGNDLCQGLGFLADSPAALTQIAPWC